VTSELEVFVGNPEETERSAKPQMRVPFLDLKAQHAPLIDKFGRAIREVIESSAFAGGPFVESFEREFAAYCDSSYAIGVGNGTDALGLGKATKSSRSRTHSSPRPRPLLIATLSQCLSTWTKTRSRWTRPN